MTVISLSGKSLSFVVSEPIRLVSSSLTIFITIWPGVKLLRTSCPIALSVTVLMNCFTTLKLTSASSKAILTSLRAALTSSSVSLPLPRKPLNMFCNLSDKLSNAKPLPPILIIL